MHTWIDRQIVVDPEVLRRHIDAGLISARTDRNLNLVVLNYTHAAQEQWQWDDTIKVCRGLGLDLTSGEVVFRGPRKFFGLSETSDIPEANIHRLKRFGKPEITEKLDGAIGLGFRRGGQLHISTRGWSKSSIAQRATELLRARYPEARWPDGFTPFFEIISPLTTQVVDYEAREDLVILGLVENATGREMRHRDVNALAQRCGFPHVDLLEGPLDAVLTGAQHNREGVVLAYWGPENHVYRVKVKFQAYKDSSRVARFYTLLRAWSDLRLGRSMADVVPEGTAAPVAKWVATMRAELGTAFHAVRVHIDAIVDSVPEELRRTPEDLEQDGKTRYALMQYLLNQDKTLGWVAFEKMRGSRHIEYGADVCAQWEHMIWKLVMPKNNRIRKLEE